MPTAMPRTNAKRMARATRRGCRDRLRSTTLRSSARHRSRYVLSEAGRKNDALEGLVLELAVVRVGLAVGALFAVLHVGVEIVEVEVVVAGHAGRERAVGPG